MTKEELFIISRWAYNIGVEYISDSEYDRLERELSGNSRLSEYFSRGWSEDPCPYELLSKYNLDDLITPVIYNYKTESIDSLNSDDEVKRELIDLNERTRLSYKLDGFSIRLNYYNGKFVVAKTRTRAGGDSKDLTGISSMFKHTIDLPGRVMVAGELYIKNSKFNEYKLLRGVVSQRNGVSTAIANNDVGYLGYKCYNIYTDGKLPSDDKYESLVKLGFPTPKNLIVDNVSKVFGAVQILGRGKDLYDAPTDGVVLENSSMQYALRIGSWAESCNYSYIIGYTFNRGMFNDSALVVIKPVKLSGKTVYEIPVTNIQTIIDNNLRIGYPIAFVERSSVNSILDVSRTEELQNAWLPRLQEFKDMVDRNSVDSTN